MDICVHEYVSRPAFLLWMRRRDVVRLFIRRRRRQKSPTKGRPRRATGRNIFCLFEPIPYESSPFDWLPADPPSPEANVFSIQRNRTWIRSSNFIHLLRLELSLFFFSSQLEDELNVCFDDRGVRILLKNTNVPSLSLPLSALHRCQDNYTFFRAIRLWSRVRIFGRSFLTFGFY